jgi:hypothetical protein
MVVFDERLTAINAIIAVSNFGTVEFPQGTRLAKFTQHKKWDKLTIKSSLLEK